MFLGEKALAMEKVKGEPVEQQEKSVAELQAELAGLKKSLGL